MLDKEEIEKIKEFNRLTKQCEKLYEEIMSIIENKFEFEFEAEFEAGYSIGNIVSKKEIPAAVQKYKDGSYIMHYPVGEDWGHGIIYFPLLNNEYLEIYYSTK